MLSNGVFVGCKGDMRGHGTVSCMGGPGGGDGGGGSGGRIALHSIDDQQYRGQLRAHGQRGTGGGDMGGPGTVFMEDMLVRDLAWQARLYVDGGGLEPPKPVVVAERNPRVVQHGLTEPNHAHVHLDHLMLQRKVNVNMSDSSECEN